MEQYRELSPEYRNKFRLIIDLRDVSDQLLDVLQELDVIIEQLGKELGEDKFNISP